eukprot:8412869-Pyramimonas_sp.AAC.2
MRATAAVPCDRALESTTRVDASRPRSGRKRGKIARQKDRGSYARTTECCASDRVRVDLALAR